MAEFNNQLLLSYAREDFDDAVRVYKALTEVGLKVWFDKVNLRPGQNWRRAISEAISRSRFFLALFSSRAVEKRGFVQAETRKALDMLLEFPPGGIYVIPIRLNDCMPQHESLHDLQWLNIFEDWGRGMKTIKETIFTELGVSPPLAIELESEEKGGLPLVLRYDGVYVNTSQVRALRFFPEGKVTLRNKLSVDSDLYEGLMLSMVRANSLSVMTYAVDGIIVELKDSMISTYSGVIQAEAITFSLLQGNNFGIMREGVYQFRRFR